MRVAGYCSKVSGAQTIHLTCCCAGQVPILPNEGEELPCNVKGPRQMREATFLITLERRLSGAGAMAA